MNSRRKLTPEEQHVLNVLYKHQPYCPGEVANPRMGQLFDALNQLVRKKRAYVEVGDDGPVYHLTAIGLSEASYAP